MPDTDVNKPGQKPSSQSGSGGSAPSEPLSLEQELDQLLADIELAVEDLDPLGDLEEAASKALEEAKASDPEYDETEDLFDVVTVGGETEEPEETQEVSEAGEVISESTLENELDELIEEVAPTKASQIPVSDAGSARPQEKKQAQMSAEQSQIDHELDALLAEANAVLGDDLDEPASEEAAAATESPDQSIIEEADLEAMIEEPVSAESAATPTDTDASTLPEPEALVETEATAAEPEAAETVVAHPESLDADAEEAAKLSAEAPAEELSAAVVEEAATAPEVVEPEATSAEPSNDVDMPVETVADVVGEAPDDASDEPVAEVVAETARSIEDLDADLAARAEEVAASEDEPTETEQATASDDDAFRSSEDVVEEVIDQHASAVQSTESPTEDATDDLAHLMAESPASAELSVAESPPAAEPKAAEPQHAPAAASPSAPAAVTSTESEVAPQPSGNGFAKTLITRVGTVFGGLTKRVQPLALRLARALSKPMELMPPRMRDDIGWLATVTLFLAIAVLVAYVLFR